MNSALKIRGGYITRRQLPDLAAYTQLLLRVKSGELVRLKAGVYAKPEALADTMINLDKVVPGGILCLYSAWSHYELTVQIPPAFCVAVKRGRKLVLPEYPPIKLYRVSDTFFQLGVVRARVGRYVVPIYDVERCVCDALRYRNKIGIETSSEILRNYLSRPDCHLDKLHNYAKILRVDTLLSRYLEIAL